jgi:hypothetical protein
LLDHVREVLRLHHYSIHTERAYGAWIRRYVTYHHMTRREDRRDGERTIEAFLTHLAVEANVSPSTQNQAMNALVFLYKQGLKKPVDQEIMRCGHGGRNICPGCCSGKKWLTSWL